MTSLFVPQAESGLDIGSQWSSTESSYSCWQDSNWLIQGAPMSEIQSQTDPRTYSQIFDSWTQISYTHHTVQSNCTSHAQNLVTDARGMSSSTALQSKYLQGMYVENTMMWLPLDTAGAKGRAASGFSRKTNVVQADGMGASTRLGKESSSSNVDARLTKMSITGEKAQTRDTS